MNVELGKKRLNIKLNQPQIDLSPKKEPQPIKPIKQRYQGSNLADKKQELAKKMA